MDRRGLELSEAELERFKELMQFFYEYRDNSKLKDLFVLFDRNRNGIIEKIELESVMRQVSGENTSEQEIRDMINEADSNNDGVIELSEFIAVMKKHRDS